MRVFFIFLIPFVVLFADKTKFEIGKKLYLQTCVSCHGEDGKAQTQLHLIVKPRNLHKTILNEEQTYKIIKKGAHFWGAKADIMPSFEYVYSDEQIEAIAHYVAQNFHPDSAQKVEELYAQSESVPAEKKTKMLKRGKKIYKRNCGWCHGMSAQGDGEASRNPELSIFPYDLTKTLLTPKQMFLYAKYGGHYWGTDKEDMPSWSPKYDDYTIKSVIRYINEKLRKGEQ